MPRFSDEQVKLAVVGRRAPKTYPFPGSDEIEIGIRLLSDEQLDLARIQAAEYCKARKVDLLMDPEMLDRAIQRHVLLHAVIDPKTSQPFFASHEEVTHLDSALMRTLYELYAAHQQAMDPLAYASEEEVKALIAQLGKSGMNAARLSLFDRPTLLSFVLSMASMLLERSPTLRSSTG